MSVGVRWDGRSWPYGSPFDCAVTAEWIIFRIVDALASRAGDSHATDNTIKFCNVGNFADVIHTHTACVALHFWIVVAFVRELKVNDMVFISIDIDFSDL